MVGNRGKFSRPEFIQLTEGITVEFLRRYEDELFPRKIWADRAGSTTILGQPVMVTTRHLSHNYSLEPTGEPDEYDPEFLKALNAAHIEGYKEELLSTMHYRYSRLLDQNIEYDLVLCPYILVYEYISVCPATFEPVLSFNHTYGSVSRKYIHENS